VEKQRLQADLQKSDDALVPLHRDKGVRKSRKEFQTRSLAALPVPAWARLWITLAFMG